METATNALLNRKYDFRIKPASEYRKGEKVIFTRLVRFGFLAYAGTEAVVVEAHPAAGNLTLSISHSGKTVLWVPEESIDSLESGQGNSFRNLGEWIPCRKAKDGNGWLTGEYTQSICAKLDNDRIVECRGQWDIVTEIKLPDGTIIPASRIQNMVYRKYLGPVDELIEIWRKESHFISSTGVKNQRVLELGRQFNASGGFEFMQGAWRNIRGELGAMAASELNSAWHGIGDWKV